MNPFHEFPTPTEVPIVDAVLGAKPDDGMSLNIKKAWMFTEQQMRDHHLALYERYLDNLGYNEVKSEVYTVASLYASNSAGHASEYLIRILIKNCRSTGSMQAFLDGCYLAGFDPDLLLLE